MEEKEQLMIQIDNVSKVYKLGEIGGTTLRESFQRLFAKILHKEDPTKKIGAKNYNKGEKFLALDNINLTIKKGERVGIIGHNGAGKSTLLKLICRVTAPTTGEIGLNGRITSMLEVGTGFHPELTGRENIYVNGAILGMTKKEIDEVIEDIIEFSEVREFIDTPVKRYSSGMYVKLAFSVAAHLKSEIMIMDEVLAVGDMAFQNKCLTKMRSVSEDEGRTILYVSHNMNTIRQLCDRVIVLRKGHLIFNGDVDEGIAIYSGTGTTSEDIINLEEIERETGFKHLPAKMIRLEAPKNNGVFEQDSKPIFSLVVASKEKFSNVILSAFVSYGGTCVTTMMSDPIIELRKDEESVFNFTLDLKSLAPTNYNLKLVLSLRESDGRLQYLDVLQNCYSFKIVQKEGMFFNREWSLKYNGFVVGPKVQIKQ